MWARSKDNLRVLRESLESITKPYSYLVDEFIPKRIELVMRRLGVEKYTLNRKINMTVQEGLKLHKTCYYQYFLTLSYGDKPKTFKILEVPYLHNLGYGIINGVQRNFNIKLKRSNCRLYTHEANNEKTIYLNMSNLRNKVFSITYNRTRGEVSIGWSGQTYDLGSYLDEFYSRELVVRELMDEKGSLRKRYSHLKTLTLDVDRMSKKPLSKEKHSFVILSKNARKLSQIIGVELDYDYDNFLSLPNLLKILDWLVNEQNAPLIEHCQRNLMNQEWVTVGGYLREIIERAWFDLDQIRKTRETISRAIKEEKEKDLNSFIHQNIGSCLNLADLRLKIQIYLHDGSFSQLLENLNPLSVMINVRKVSLLYRGLISKRTATNEMRSLNSYMQGRLCPITTSESSVIGLVKHLALGASFNEEEDLLVPYYRVRRGELIPLIVQLNFHEEYDRKITDYSNWFSEDDFLKVRVNGCYRMCRRSEVDLVLAMPGQSASLGINMLVKANHSEPDRLLMAANMLRQTLVLKYPSSVGYLNNLYEPCRSYYLSQFVDPKAKINYLSSRFMIHKDKDQKETLVPYQDLRINSDCYDFFKNVQGPNGSYQVATHTMENQLTIGNTVRCAYGLWGGYNYEDALVISDRLVKNEMFTSLHFETLSVPVFKTLAGDETVTKEGINLFKYDLDKIDENGVVKVGSYVRADDVLVMKVKPIKRKNYTPEQRLLFSILGEKHLSVKNNFFHLPNHISSGWVYSVDYVRGKCTEEQFAKWSDVMNERQQVELMDLLRNYCIKNHSNEEVESTVESWVKKPKSRPAAVQRIIEYYDRLRNVSNNSISKEDCLFVVQITLIREKTLKVGDKLTGMHGNKGVVSKIVPECDMPFDESGKPVDIIISNVSVYGRLNLSQMKESHTVGLSRHVIESVRRITEGMRLGIQPDERKVELLRRLFGFEDFGTWSKEVTLEEDLRLDVTPFCKGGDADLKEISESFDYKEMLRLRCGRTGEYYDRPTHVGHIYLLKLKHTVDTKFNARSIGSNSLKINQPTRGKLRTNVSDFITEGQAQKIGTMEKDALLSRGLPKFLQELFTFRSDAINSRRQVLSGQIFAEDGYKDRLVLPEATKVFVKYLACLGIKLEIKHEEEARLSFYQEQDILSLSKGEVRVADTYHYKTKKAVNNGLYCYKIFGSDKNLSCECEKYVGSRYLGVTCPQCGVYVTTNEERRNFFGHISLTYPVINSQIFKQLLPLFTLDYSASKIRTLANFSTYLWVRPDGQESFVTEWRQVDEGSMLSGAEALEHVISKIDVVANYRRCLVTHLRYPEKVGWAKLYRQYADFVRSGNTLQNVIMRKILILPKVLRPIIFNPNGTYISSDIVNSILTVIRRNNRLLELRSNGLLPFIIEKMKLMLQEAVDNYLWGVDDYGQTVHNNSIVYALKGKMGIARKYMLAKRVNNSGRAVLIQNPLLPLGKCRLPMSILKKIMLPLIQRKMVEKNIATDFFEAFEMISNNDYNKEMINGIVNELVKEVPVVLNRNPTLHALSMQAFYAEPVDHQAIELNPLTLKAFGGDVDGDQIAVFAVISRDSIDEVKERMINRNVYNLSDGTVTTILLKELGLAVYLMTLEPTQESESIWVTDSQIESLRSRKNVRTIISWYRGDGKRFKTTLGRAHLVLSLESVLGRFLRFEEFKALNRPWDKSVLEYVYLTLTLNKVNYYKMNEFCDRLKLISNEYSYSHNCSFSVGEIENASYDWGRRGLVDNIMSIEDALAKGTISVGERESRLVELWKSVEPSIMESTVSRFEDTQHRLVIDSKFRGGYDSLMAISNVRGMITLKSDYLIPVLSSLNEGYDEMEFWNLSNILDKLIVKSLGTAKGGYFNRQMTEILREVMVTDHDCGDEKGLDFEVGFLRENLQFYRGRVLCHDVPEIGLRRGDYLSYKDLDHPALDRTHVTLRSPITCRLSRGVCAVCHGLKIDTLTLPEIGDSTGTLAAQAMTEPVTQTLLQTKHLRYIQLESDELESVTTVKRTGEITFEGRRDLLVEIDGGHRYMSDEPALVRVGEDSYEISYGSVLVGLDSRAEEGSPLIRTDLRKCVYAPYRCRVVQVSEERSLVRYDLIDLDRPDRRTPVYLVADSFDRMGSEEESKTYERGELVFSLKYRATDTEHTLDSTFNAFMHAMIGINNYNYKNIELFDVRAPFAGKLRVTEGGLTLTSPDRKTRKWNIENVASYLGLNLPGDMQVEEGHLIFRGTEGEHPLDMIKTGDYTRAGRYFLNLIRNIYVKEDIKMLSVYLEVFVKEFYLLGFPRSVRPNQTARSLLYLREKHGLNRVVPHVRKSLKEAYIDNVSPLSIIMYENIVKSIIRESIGGFRDRLVSIHSHLVLGKPAPVMQCFDAGRWRETYDLKSD